MIQNWIPRFFLFRKLFGTEFRGFFHPKMFWNRIPRVFLFQEMVRNWIPRVLLFREMVRKGIPKVFLFRKLFERNFEVFLIQKWFGTEFRGFFSSEKWFGMEFWGFFSSEKWFGMEFRGVSLPRNRRNSNGTAVCSILFCMPRNNFFVGKWQPYSWPTRALDLLLSVDSSGGRSRSGSYRSAANVTLAAVQW